MAWFILILAGACEILWAVGLKKYGLSLSWGGIATLVGVVLSFGLLGIAMRTLPLGSAYAIWTGIGAIGAAIVGMWLFDEPRDWPRVLCIAAILAGIVGLKVLTPRSTSDKDVSTEVSR